MITDPGLYPLLSNVDYHADPAPPADGGSLSVSGARRLLPPSTPRKYRRYVDHPGDRTPTDAMLFGSVMHSIVLEDGAGVTVVDSDTWRGNAGKARTQALADGLYPILIGDMGRVQAMVDQLRRHPTASRVLWPPARRTEVSAFWRHPRTGRWCRGRFDVIPGAFSGGRFVIGEYKTAGDASDQGFGKAAYDHGYYLADHWYREGARILGLAPDPVLLFVVQETCQPYEINVIELDAGAKELGDRHMDVAANLFDRCVTSGEWPGYPEGVNLASVPAWATRREGIS